MIANKKSWYSIKISSDLILLNLIFLLSAVLAQSWTTLVNRRYMFFLLFTLNVLWYFSSKITDLYDILNFHSLSNQVLIVLKNVTMQAIVSIFFLFALKENLFTRNFIVYNFLFLNIGVLVRILILKAVQKKLLTKENYLKNLIVIGTNNAGKDFYELIQEHPEFGYKIVGFVTDADNDWKLKKIGELADLDSIIQYHNADEVVVSISNASSEKLNEIVAVCNKNAVRIHILPDYYQFLSKKFLVSVIGNFPIITIRNEPLGEMQWRFVKRTFDLIFSLLISILFLSWIVPLIAIAIKLSSAGPVFFIQDRIGLKNEKFRCYKFRTMRTIKNGEKKFMPAVEGDPRITKLGSFLRKSNLDELPQFCNVLKGEMSVVGPRPHAIAYHEEYVKYFVAIKLRHIVKPGLTGWAQVNGLRGDVSGEEENKKRTIKRIEYDLWYIENWSFSLDLQIILLTVWQMLSRNTKAH